MSRFADAIDALNIGAGDCHDFMFKMPSLEYEIWHQTEIATRAAMEKDRLALAMGYEPVAY